MPKVTPFLMFNDQLEAAIAFRAAISAQNHVVSITGRRAQRVSSLGLPVPPSRRAAR